MDPLQSNEAIQQFMRLLEENGRQEQSADLSQLMWYMDGMMRQFDAVTQELQEVKQQLSQPHPPSIKYAVQRTAARLEHKVQQLRDGLNDLWSRIAECASNAIRDFKELGVSGLDRAVSGLHIKIALESLQENISTLVADTRKNIEKVETMGQEFRSMGGHLRNAGRAMVGKETQAVDGGQEGRFQSAVLAPMRTTQRLFSSMNNATLAAIGNMEHLEQTAETTREARAERRAEKKPSIRQALAKNREETAARSAPAPDKERKAPEAAL